MKKILSVMVALLTSFCGCAAASLAHTDDTHAHPVIVPGECPQFGENKATWINVAGHLGLSLSTGGSDWAGFEVMANSHALESGILPGVDRGPLPAGVFTFKISSKSQSPFDLFIDVWSRTGCFFHGGDVFPKNTVSINVPPGAGEIQVYLSNPGPSRAVVSDFRFNGIPVPATTIKDRGETVPGVGFCTSFNNPCN